MVPYWEVKDFILFKKKRTEREREYVKDKIDEVGAEFGSVGLCFYPLKMCCCCCSCRFQHIDLPNNNNIQQDLELVGQSFSFSAPRS